MNIDDEQKVNKTMLEILQKAPELGTQQCTSIQELLDLFESYIEHIYYVNSSIKQAKKHFTTLIVASIITGLATLVLAADWITGIIIDINLAVILVLIFVDFIAAFAFGKFVDSAIEANDAYKFWLTMSNMYEDIAIMRIRTAKIRRLQNYDI